MSAPRKTRLYAILAVVCGAVLTVALTLYALSSNIDLFYTPSEILYGKNETQEKPAIGQRLRVGGMVMPAACAVTAKVWKSASPFMMRRAPWR